MIAPAHPSRSSLAEQPLPAEHAFHAYQDGRPGAGFASQVIEKHPVAVLAVAGIIGVVIGCFVKRRGDQPMHGRFQSCDR